MKYILKYIIKTSYFPLISVLVGLYEEPEKPNNALDFLRQHMGSDGPETADVESLKLEVTELRKKVEELTEENVELKSKVSYSKLCVSRKPSTSR